MKVRVTVSFNHDMNNKDEAERLVDLLKEDGRITAAIHTYGGDAIGFEWERRRDRKVKDEVATNVVALPLTQTS